MRSVAFLRRWRARASQAIAAEIRRDGALPDALRAAAILVAGLLAAAVLASLPSRLALVDRQAQFVRHSWQLGIVGVAVDVRDGAPILFGALLLAWLSTRALRGSPTSLRRAAVAAVALAFTLLMFGVAGATEFRIERGAYPNFMDARGGLSNLDYVWSALPTFLLERYRLRLLLSALAFGLVCYAVLRTTRRLRLGFRELTLSAALLAPAVLGAVAIHRASPLLFASIPHFRVVESPVVWFFTGFGTITEHVRVGLTAVVRGLSLDALAGDGARLFGWDPKVVERIEQAERNGACAPHPLAVSLDASLAASPDELATRLSELSAALGLERPLRLWQVSLESFRADDVNALEPRASREITPFANALYAQADAGAGDVIAARWAFQGGAHTSNALAAHTCGVGVMGPEPGARHRPAAAALLA